MKKWLKATGIRCARTFFTTILGVFTADKLITDVDWKAALLAAVSATVYIFILCLIAGLPEVQENEIAKIGAERTDADRRDDSEGIEDAED